MRSQTFHHVDVNGFKENFGTEKTRTIYMSPCGATFCQAKARQLLADYDHLWASAAFSRRSSS